MIIKLFQPPIGNWLLIAEELNDPSTWDRFVPTHAPNSERAQFDKCALDIASGHAKLKICKDFLKRGASAYAYDWETDEDTIITHAMQVAEALSVDLTFEEPAKKSA